MTETFIFDPETKELITKGTEHNSYPGGIGKLYYDRLKELANSPEEIIAQIDAETDTKQNYKLLLTKSIKLAQYMQSIGIHHENNIAMCSYNHLNSAVVSIAVQFLGAVLASTDPILSLKDTKYLLDMIKPKVVFVSEGSEDLIREAIEENHLNCKLITFATSCVEGFEMFEDIMKEEIVEEAFEPFYVHDLSSTSAILFSSGTTSMPKGICLSHNYFLGPLSSYPRAVLKWVMLNYTSSYWISCVFNLAVAINCGSARLLCKQFSKEKHWTLIEKYEVNYLILSSTYCIESIKYLQDDVKLPKLETLVVAGGSIPEKDLSILTNKLPNALVGYVYALTEGAIVSQYKKGDKFGSVGKPIQNTQIIKIVDPDTEEALPLNKVGEIRIKHELQMTGYYNVDSTEAWDTDGFLKTGDLGYLDDEFNLFVVDRIKEMFKFRSWHVVPAKIENLLCSCPDVLYAVVLGKPTADEDENHAMAIVCLHEGRSATAEEIEAFANGQLDWINKIRAGVVIIDKSMIQFTPTGKINRRLLKQKYIITKV